MPRGIVERRIHQHGIGTVGLQASGCEGFRGRRHIKYDNIGNNAVRRRVVMREPRQLRIDLDQYQIEATDALGERQSRRTDSRAELYDTIASTCCRRGRKQDRIMAGAMTGAGLA